MNCIFDHVQWISALNDFTAHGYVMPWVFSRQSCSMKFAVHIISLPEPPPDFH